MSSGRVSPTISSPIIMPESSLPAASAASAPAQTDNTDALATGLENMELGVGTQNYSGKFIPVFEAFIPAYSGPFQPTVLVNNLSSNPAHSFWPFKGASLLQLVAPFALFNYD